jgi:SAM-dependent methyltransferase
MHTVDEQFKLGDAASYDDRAETFDRFQACSAGPLVARLIELAGVTRGQRILDVGTGTGIVALEAAARVGPVGKVLGIDLSEGMLAVARDKAARAKLDDRLEFRRMDAEVLELEDGGFDRVLSLFAMFHFPNPLAALREKYRVLKPGGTISLGVGGGAPLLSGAGLLQGVRRVGQEWRRLRGRRVTAPRLLNELVEKYFPGADAPEVPTWVRRHRDKVPVLCSLMRQAGFTALRTGWAGTEVLLQTPQDFWELQLTFDSVARKRLAQAPRSCVEELRNEFFRTCTDVLARGGQLAYPAGARYVVGVRPTV